MDKKYISENIEEYFKYFVKECEKFEKKETRASTEDGKINNIFGIEKDYRLARVSKISLFMNGAGEGNIIFGDGLENTPEKQIENNSFDILVANPPYSVSAFKQHLKLKNNSFIYLIYIKRSLLFNITKSN